MLNTYEHIIWDWNGTLLDDVDLCVEIINGMLNERDMPQISVEMYQHLFEFPVEAYYRKLGFDFVFEPFEKLAGQFVETYKSRVHECKLHASSIDTLNSVAELDISQSVLSSLNHSALEEELQHHKLIDRFELVRGIDDHFAAGKIEVGRALVKELRIELNRTVLIGDTHHDFEVATDLGIPCILISNGHYSKARLESAHDCVIDSLQELID
ncbi:MAG: HAD hydrolase-like protein [Pseudomonadales bacterium]|nr:HAD hydrolase-like protein [Pseudomonadales bacterium]